MYGIYIPNKAVLKKIYPYCSPLHHLWKLFGKNGQLLIKVANQVNHLEAQWQRLEEQQKGTNSTQPDLAPRLLMLLPRGQVQTLV